MKVRLLPRNSINYPWSIEVHDPHSGKWRQIGIYSSYTYARIKTQWLSKKKVGVFQPKKEEFMEKLSGKNEA